MKINDKVICVLTKPFSINSIAPDLELNKEYLATEVFVCSCGEKHVNVGLKLDINYVECYKCRETLPPTNHWCNSSRFKLKE